MKKGRKTSRTRERMADEPALPEHSSGDAASTFEAPGRPVLRIIGGEFRGRTIAWSGDVVTRPMKDTVRESVFNLVGGWLPGLHAIDLFAGSGAIGLEALSRGALHVTLIERHFPTVRIIRQNIETLGAGERCTVVASDTFYWSRQFLASGTPRPTVPWAVFCSPPYEFYSSRKAEMLELIRSLKQASPEGSVLVVESDSRLDPADLPDAAEWRVRNYAIAQIAVVRPRGRNR